MSGYFLGTQYFFSCGPVIMTSGAMESRQMPYIVYKIFFSNI